MIKKLLGTLVVGMLVAAHANAASISITGPVGDEVTVGDTFQLSLIGEWDNIGFLTGGISFMWDSALVSLDAVQLDLPAAADFSCPGSLGCPPTTANSTPVVWGEFLSPLIQPGAGPTLMATLTFTAIASAGGIAVFSMESDTMLTGGWFDSDFNLVDEPALIDYALTVNAVPLPAAVWFMIGGLGTLLGVRRK